MMGDLLSKPSLKSTAIIAFLAISQGQPEAHGSGPSTRPAVGPSVRLFACPSVYLCICLCIYDMLIH